MLKNYFIIALRNLRRQRGYAIINVIGLAVGMACCLMILLYVRDELGYDRFHEHADRLVRLNKVVTPQEGATERHAITSGLMGPTMVEEFPEVEQAVRFLPWFDDVLMTRGEKKVKVSDVAFTDANFFEVFDFELLRGDPATVLEAPSALVLTEHTARRLFGDEDPIGQTVTAVNNLDYTVTGIATDPPANSHLTYSALISWSTTVPGTGPLDYVWMNNWLTQVHYTYLLLTPEADLEALETKFPAFMQQHFPERAEQYHLYLQPFTDIYLGSADLLYTDHLRVGNRTYVYIFSAIAVLILLIACINFTNLATARAAQRAAEVGVRKAIGATRAQLARQFLGESMLMVGLALTGAVMLVEAVLPSFNAFTGKQLTFNVPAEPFLIASLLGLLLVVGCVAGLYPALVLSRLRTVRVLKGTGRIETGGLRLRRVLVTAQFVASIALLICTAVVYRQMQFIQTKDLGFEADQVVVLSLEDTAISEQSFEAFKAELLRHPSIVQATGSSPVPGQGTMGFTIVPEGKPEDETWEARALRVDDDDLLGTFGMELVAGRYLSQERPTDTSSVVINEALARTLGWDQPLGKRLDIVGEVEQGTVVGVVRDFHYESLHHAIDPLVIYLAPRHQNLALRLSGDDVAGTLAYVRETWERFEARHPFTYTFLDHALSRRYEREGRLFTTLGIFALLAIGIACLGLFGLAAFTTQQRTKEIGVRKILGASFAGLVLLLSKDMLKLVAVAFVVAAPLAYVAMQRWLADFAYRVEIGAVTVVAAGVLVLVIAWMSVSYQAAKAALTDPVKSLRYE